MQNFSFPSLSSRSEPRSHKISLEPHTEATRKDPDPKKIRGPHLASLICVPNFKVISGLKVPQLEKPNDPQKPHLDMSGLPLKKNLQKNRKNSDHVNIL
jgi:hypothetical protein